MKQILSLFLFLLPCLAWAQYPSNGNQKITLGEQTTADGIIWRGVSSDTTLTAKSDTAAYFVLDTANLNLYTYKASATGKKWIQLGSDTTSLNLVSRFAAKLNISDTASMLNNYWRAGKFSGVLPIANGGTNSSTQNFVDLTTTQSSIGGAKTFTSSVTGASFKPTVNDSAITGIFLPKTNMIGFSTNNVERMRITDNGNLIIGTKDADVGGSVDGINLRPDGRLNVANSSSAAANSFIYYGDRRGTNNEGSVFMFAMGGFFKGTVGVAGQNNGSENSAITFNTIFNNSTVTERMRINYQGRLGIGTATPSEALHVVGNGRFTAVGAGTFSNNLNITSDGTLTTATSDEKFKYNIKPLNYGLSTILQLNPVNFQWIEGEEEDLGFIAQDVAEIIPEAVNTNWNSDLLFRYESLIPILTKAIQQQQALIKALEQRIINLENK